MVPCIINSVLTYWCNSRSDSQVSPASSYAIMAILGRVESRKFLRRRTSQDLLVFPTSTWYGGTSSLCGFAHTAPSWVLAYAFWIMNRKLKCLTLIPAFCVWFFCSYFLVSLVLRVFWSRTWYCTLAFHLLDPRVNLRLFCFWSVPTGLLLILK